MLTKQDKRYIEGLFDKKFDQKIEELAIMIQNSIAELASKTDLCELKTDFREFKEETNENFTSVKKDISILKSEVVSLKWTMLDRS